MTFIIALLIFAGFLAILIIGMYNGLIRLRNKVDEGWADIETQLKKRYDLIPNLISTVKGYAKHEQGTFEKVTAARTAAMNAEGMGDKQKAENMLTGALKSIFALSENYPDLKANQNFMQLQETLAEVEEHIQLSRRYYNATVRDLNTKIQVFPSNLIANWFKFKEREFFEIKDEEERKAPKVSFEEKEAPKEEPKEEPKSE